jgi:HAD superfamily hydrolase (TIGR01509 family)
LSSLALVIVDDDVGNLKRQDLMSAIFFGSIGTLADTSELQRQSFNEAFALHKLNWNWSREEYMNLLEKSGGRDRIEEYANSTGQSVDADAIHHSKSEIFRRSMYEHPLNPRPGVVEVIQTAKQKGVRLAFVTTTFKENVLSLLQALQSSVDVNDFDLVLDVSKVEHSKPFKDAYVFALTELSQTSDQCVAIEDNLNGLDAAKSAGLACVAFPNQNTAHHNFQAADLQTDCLEFNQLQGFLSDL